MAILSLLKEICRTPSTKLSEALTLGNITKQDLYDAVEVEPVARNEQLGHVSMITLQPFTSMSVGLIIKKNPANSATDYVAEFTNPSNVKECKYIPINNAYVRNISNSNEILRICLKYFENKLLEIANKIINDEKTNTAISAAAAKERLTSVVSSGSKSRSRKQIPAITTADIEGLYTALYHDSRFGGYLEGNGHDTIYNTAVMVDKGNGNIARAIKGNRRLQDKEFRRDVGLSNAASRIEHVAEDDFWNLDIKPKSKIASIYLHGFTVYNYNLQKKKELLDFIAQYLQGRYPETSVEDWKHILDSEDFMKTNQGTNSERRFNEVAGGTYLYFSITDASSLRRHLGVDIQRNFLDETYSEEENSIIIDLSEDRSEEEIEKDWENVLSYLDPPDCIYYDDLEISVPAGYSYDEGPLSDDVTIDWEYPYDVEYFWGDDAWDLFDSELYERKTQKKFTLKEILDIFDPKKVNEFLKERHRESAEEHATENYDPDDYMDYDDIDD